MEFNVKIPIKGFNKEFLPGSLTEHPVDHLVHFGVGMRVTSFLCRMLVIQAVLLSEIFSGCCGLLLNGRETI